jgi:hypothetical protein
MTAAKIDDPLEAFQVHGCSGLMGCILLAFFKIDDGIFYGGKSYEAFDEASGEMSKKVAGAELLGIQLFGCLMIGLWSGILCSIFFFISMKFNWMRLSEQDEILGGDLYYFGPIEFEGNPADYDLADICGKLLMESAKKLKENDNGTIQEVDAVMEGGNHSVGSESNANDIETASKIIKINQIADSKLA